MLAEFGVAHITQMRHLGAVADVRLLHLDERAGLGLLAQLVARPHVGPRADVRGTPDMRALHAGAFDDGLGVHGRVDQRCVWAHDRVLTDHGVAFEERSGQHGHVLREFDVVFDPRGVGVEDRHAVEHPVLAYATVVRLRQRGELQAVVHAFDAQRVGRGERPDRAARFRGLQRVGEIELALRVVVVEVRDGLGKQIGVEHVHGRVHLLHREFAPVGVLLLDDAQHVAVTIADDAAVSGRVVEDRGQHGGTVAALLVERHELLQRDGVEQWHVGRGDQHRAMQVAFLGQLRHRALDRAAGAGDVVLVDDVDVRVVGPCRLGDAVGLIVHDDGQCLRLQMSD